MVVAFCGHDKVSSPDRVREWLNHVLDQLIGEGEITCYLGGYGGFDRIAASVVREKKQQNPCINSVLVIPYLNRRYDEEPYDYTIFPSLESVPPRYAIIKRNEWMVSEADVVVAYVTHSWGGAAKTLEYAQRKSKRIISYSSHVVINSRLEKTNKK